MEDLNWAPDGTLIAPPRASAYPVVLEPQLDPRFTFALVADVITVLERRGYPRPRSGNDFVCLQQALFRFVYGTAVEQR